MNFLRKLFGGSGTSADQRSIYVYVRPKRCDEIVEVRIDLLSDLSMTDDGSGYWMRKIAQAVRCPFPAEITLHFDKNRKVVSQEVTDGELVDRDTYDTWAADNQRATDSSARGTT